MITHRETRNALRWLLEKLDVEVVLPGTVELSSDISLGPEVIGICPRGTGVRLRARRPEVMMEPESCTARDNDCAMTLFCMLLPKGI